MNNIASITEIAATADGCEFFSVPFQAGSAFYSCKQSIDTAGTFYKHSLSFRVVGIGLESERLLEELSRAAVVDLEDVSGVRLRIGSLQIPVKVESETDTGKRPGDFRGISVTVKWDAPSPAERR